MSCCSSLRSLAYRVPFALQHRASKRFTLGVAKAPISANLLLTGGSQFCFDSLLASLVFIAAMICHLDSQCTISLLAALSPNSRMSTYGLHGLAWSPIPAPARTLHLFQQIEKSVCLVRRTRRYRWRSILLRSVYFLLQIPDISARSDFVL